MLIYCKGKFLGVKIREDFVVPVGSWDGERDLMISPARLSGGEDG